MSSSIVILDESNFEEHILHSSLPALVDLWAPWCAPCRMVAPIIEELAEAYQGKAVVGKLNVDENHAIASRYGVTSIPTLIFFHNGEVTEQLIGVPAGNAKRIIEDKLKDMME
ncbi:thioredoxin [candidate division KSB3 bacterium]|uniref:Thioredoxin n=1 Tax=candidate division KSB3 bacterium TaxID=2044937 RepID=A0A2G6E579_9BACT|nr:MAG: thioredoxin [candidate division KSB3 bacterium]PIE29764.1 MAG: thioredoxin [candidate division KSB3 bacterium]